MDPKAEEAMALFAYRAGREAGSVAATIGGLDVAAGLHRRNRAVFGWHAGAHRRLSGLFWRVKLDPAANAIHGPVISAADSPVMVLVLDTDEEAVDRTQDGAAHIRIRDRLPQGREGAECGYGF